MSIVQKPHQSYDITWSYKKNKDKRIRLISGDLFYQIVTGEKNALKQLYEVLQKVLEEKGLDQNEINTPSNNDGLNNLLREELLKNQKQDSSIANHLFYLSYESKNNIYNDDNLINNFQGKVEESIPYEDFKRDLNQYHNSFFNINQELNFLLDLIRFMKNKIKKSNFDYNQRKVYDFLIERYILACLNFNQKGEMLNINTIEKLKNLLGTKQDKEFINSLIQNNQSK